MSELLEKLYITLQNIEILRVSLRLQKRKETNTMELENNEEGNGKGNKNSPEAFCFWAVLVCIDVYLDFSFGLLAFALRTRTQLSSLCFPM